MRKERNLSIRSHACAACPALPLCFESGTICRWICVPDPASNGAGQNEKLSGRTHGTSLLALACFRHGAHHRRAFHPKLHHFLVRPGSAGRGRPGLDGPDPGPDHAVAALGRLLGPFDCLLVSGHEAAHGGQDSRRHVQGSLAGRDRPGHPHAGGRSARRRALLQTLLGSDEWSFICDEPVRSGDRVQIRDVSGNTLVVAPKNNK